MVAVALVLVTGCGSGDDAGDGVTVSDISKAEFIKQADSICEENVAKMQADFRAYALGNQAESPQEPSRTDFSELIDAVVVPNIEREIAEIQALGAPAGGKEEVGAFVAALEGDLEKAKAEPRAVLAYRSPTFLETKRKARDYGLHACATR